MTPPLSHLLTFLALSFAPLGSSHQVLPELHGWFQTQGGHILDGIRLETIPQFGRGIVSTVPLARDQVIAKVPLKQVIHADLVAHVLEENMGDIANVNLVDRFAIFLLIQQHQGDLSPWKQFLWSVPENDFHHPLFYGPETKAKLRSTPVFLDELEYFQNMVDTNFNKYSNTYPDLFADFVLDDFRWAVALVQSRVHGIVFKDAAGEWVKRSSLTPFADLLNTAFPTDKLNADCATDEQGEFLECKTTKSVQVGEQLFSPYGVSSTSNERINNQKLLLHYGFAVQVDPSSVDEYHELYNFFVAETAGTASQLKEDL